MPLLAAVPALLLQLLCSSLTLSLAGLVRVMRAHLSVEDPDVTWRGSLAMEMLATDSESVQSLLKGAGAEALLRDIIASPTCSSDAERTAGEVLKLIEKAPAAGTTPRCTSLLSRSARLVSFSLYSLIADS